MMISLAMAYSVSSGAGASRGAILTTLFFFAISTAACGDDSSPPDSWDARIESIAEASDAAEADGGLPPPTGACPRLADGLVTFAPAGIQPRQVKLWVGAQGGGALVLYWHGTGSRPDEAQVGLDGALSQITAAGGIVAAPEHDPAAGTFPWFLVTGSRLDDVQLADEIVACAVRDARIDPRRIHTTGMSAGGLQTAHLSFRRSRYVASAATYSGGILSFSEPPYEDPTNKLAALIFHGGPNDIVVVSFQEASETYSRLIRARGGFTVICDHGGSHSIPSGGGAAVWRFFQDHPYGTSPSPYEVSGLPSELPSYCVIDRQ